MATYYIDPGGSDSTGNGSIGAPWKSLFKACSSVTTPGNIIHVYPGSYTETSQSVQAPGVSIVGEGDTSAITSNYAGTLIYASSTSVVDGNQSISNIKIIGTYPSPTADTAIYVYRRENFIIHHVTIEDFYTNAITMSSSTSNYCDGNKIYDCTIINCSKYVVGDQGYGNVRLGWLRDFEFYNNIITQEDRGARLNGYGIKFHNYGYLMGLKLYNNTITIPPKGYSNDDYDFTMELWNCRGGIEVYNNTFYGCVDFGCNASYIALNDDGGYGFALKFHHNNCIQSTHQAYEERGIDIERNASEGVYIYNNYFSYLAYPITTSMNGSETQEDFYIYCNIITNMSGVDGYPNNGIGMKLGHEYSASNTYNNMNIWNNVIYSGARRTREGIRLEYDDYGNDISVQNNIIIGFNYSIRVVDAEIDGLAINDNMVYDNTTNLTGYFNCSISNDTSSANIIDDPEFESSSDYHLSSNDSPAYHAGNYVSLFTGNYDYDDVAWNNPPSIGAYEYAEEGDEIISINMANFAKYSVL